MAEVGDGEALRVHDLSPGEAQLPVLDANPGIGRDRRGGPVQDLDDVGPVLDRER